MYFDLACALCRVSQEDVARRAGVPSSTLSRAFSGKLQAKRDKLLRWSDILFDLCPDGDKDLLKSLEDQMLHTLGYSTRSDEQQGIEQLPYFQQRVSEVLAQREQPPT